MKSYNGFTPEQRIEGDKIIKKAIHDGVLCDLSETKCFMCGQDKGIRHYHCEDYSPENIIDDCRPLCWRCHMMLHCRFKHPKSWSFYKRQVYSGVRFQPVFSGDYRILNRENFID